MNASKSLIAGLDIGTTNVKAAVFDISGALMTVASAPVHLLTPQPDWAEENPNEWWEAAISVLRQVTQQIDPCRLAALGLTGQCPGHVLVDEEGNSLGNAIIWRDQRAKEEGKWLYENLRTEKAIEWAGRSFLGDASLPPARLLWLKRYQTSQLEKCRSIMQPKDFIGLKLTGISGTDINSAYCLYNPHTRSYHEEYFNFLGVPVELMPPAFQPHEILGKVHPQAAQKTGLPAGLPVIVGTIDAYCDNIAAGAILPGRAADVSGTSEVISLGVDKAHARENEYLADLGNDTYFLCGPTQTGSDTLLWYAKNFYPEFKNRVDFEALEHEAMEIPAGSEGLIFLPYLNGERAPLWDSNIRGGFIGLSGNHRRSHCTRAVYEGIGFVIRHLLDVFAESSGQSIEAVTVCGGGSSSPFWNQLKADILQKPVSVLEINQSGCLGAAILASQGVGIFTDLKDANLHLMRFTGIYSPDQNKKNIYDIAYRRFRELYVALKPVFSLPSKT